MFLNASTHKFNVLSRSHYYVHCVSVCSQFTCFCWHEWNTLFLHININFWDKGTKNIQYVCTWNKKKKLQLCSLKLNRLKERPSLLRAWLLSLDKQWLKIHFIWVRLYQMLKVWVEANERWHSWLMADSLHLVHVRVLVWFFLILSVFGSLISSCSSIQPSLCALHPCIYFCGTSLKHGITTDYLIPLALTHTLCVVLDRHQQTCMFASGMHESQVFVWTYFIQPQMRVDLWVGTHADYM